MQPVARGQRGPRQTLSPAKRSFSGERITAGSKPRWIVRAVGRATIASPTVRGSPLAVLRSTLPTSVAPGWPWVAHTRYSGACDSGSVLT